MKNSLFLMLILISIMALGLTACGGETSAPTNPSQGDAVAGKQLFITCSACHGPTGEGGIGLDNDLTTSKFVSSLSDTELVEFVKVGRKANDPANTTGITMPPKGSNPGLSDQDLYDIVAYIRILKK